MRALLRATPAVAAALSALAVAACAPGPTPGRTAVADGVKFDYALAPTGKAGDYRLTLALADAKSGAAISDANVAVSLYGPGIDGDAALVNLSHDATTPTAYVANVPLPKAASYRLTFQVNRPAAASAQAVFTAQPPAAG